MGSFRLHGKQEMRISGKILKTMTIELKEKIYTISTGHTALNWKSHANTHKKNINETNNILLQ